MKYLAPAYVYTHEGLQKNKLIAIGDDGLITGIIDSSQAVAHEQIEPLPQMLLLPGFVNVHSHVFQRQLRGHTHRPLSRQDTFWTWRRAMYAEAQRLTPELLYEEARQTYSEMLAAGYTSVGEFHYVHHQVDGRPYDRPNAMSEAILQAGKDTGLRVVLLMTAYARGGFQQALEAGQQRFCDATVEQYLARVEALRQQGYQVGVAPHSVRAVPGEWFRAIAAYSREHSLPLHVHADEQVAEIEQCRTAHGCRPIELLERYEALSPRTTIVHATHATEHELDILAQYGSTVCVCPTTEGDLGDGIAPYEDLRAREIPLTIGSDSNTRLDPLEELRWAEYSARMRYQRRRVLVADELAAPGPLLLDYGTRRGAAALAIQAGEIAPDQAADFVAIDLEHRQMRGWSEEDLLDTLFFGASSEVIAQTWVQGVCVYRRNA
ncbi:formimidoylglutamate deiminase [Ktedonobacter sp. SOSP1-85]|uniref:formimidoylglutamate deiminase n=1 Tax=Ktedonobacter sp. SOSP1-85 TaxID=2778367 RepID=UPI001A1CCF6F|nr:formimidoylglutamate deiminase [Ktedonobacter sp. SOSP1-85]GHO73152.1 formimidoylglutamate deiminase [Ktedonobacter sp. SOSP1-85]